MPDILADYREWREQQAIRVSTHSDGCHMWHEQCMIHRLADALAVEQAKRAASEAEIDALEYVVEEGRIACKEDYGILRSWLCRLRPAWESTPDEPSTPGEGTRQAEGIVTRLRQTRADMIGTDDEQHYWDCHEAAGEIERLRAQPCPYVTGTVTRYCTLTPFRLTDAERFVLREVCSAYADRDDVASNEIAAVIDRLLERTRNGLVDGRETGQ